MRLNLCVSLLFIFNATLIAQKTVTRQPVKVVDFGQLYSTYSWESTNAELNANVGDVMANTIIAASTETAWPAGIATLDARNTNREMMGSYKVYYLTTLNNTVAILVAPAVENHTMPAAMQSVNDIYFVIGLSGVDLQNGNSIPPAVASKVPAPVSTGDFATQLNELVQDYANNFVSLIGEEIYEDDDGLVIQYDSRASLDGATEMFFTEDLLSSTTSFQASFQSSVDPAVALKTYRKLVRQVEILKLSAFSLQKQQEDVDGNKHVQTFLPNNAAGNLDIVYQDMVIEVRIQQTETFDSKGQLVSNWTPMLEIYAK